MQDSSPDRVDKIARDINDKPLAQALSERYLAYALSTIMARSLPDVRDGLKPVHRRILYAMRQLRLGPTTPARKSARVVGDVIGRYHPHGDVAVYEAMVRLAQDFAVRYPLVDGQGNFGNIDGDNAAAMRYTEARLTPVAEALLQGLDEDCVDFRPTYDGDGEEPIVLPAAFPNLLANGATGIAVGMATNIPPHNVAELCAGFKALIASPDLPLSALLELVAGPDFPTGGVLVDGRDILLQVYTSGRGSLRLRARWEKQVLANGMWQIVVREIPYQVQKSRLIERIAALLAEKKLPSLEDVRDESAEDIRLILVPKSRNVDPEILMQQLFRQTELEIRFGVNLNVLDAKQVPQLMGLKEAMQAFLDHRHIVLQRRTRHRLAQIARRLEILSGLLIAYLNLDAIIRIIREEEEPKPVLMARFTLSALQAEAILETRLRQLRRLEELAITREYEALKEEEQKLHTLMADEALRWHYIAEEIETIAKAYGPQTLLGRRRTLISDGGGLSQIDETILIEREPITVLVSQKGWVRALRGHNSEVAEVKYKEGDGAAFHWRGYTTDKLLIFTSDGRCYCLAADKLPGGRGFGEPLRLMVDLDNDAELLAIAAYQPQSEWLLASCDGRGFRVRGEDLLAQTRAGKQVLLLEPGERAGVAIMVRGDHVAVSGGERKLLLFPLADLPQMQRGRGVLLQKYKSDQQLKDVMTLNLADGLSWMVGSRQRRETDLRPWLARRGSVGRAVPFGFPPHGRFGPMIISTENGQAAQGETADAPLADSAKGAGGQRTEDDPAQA
jgi:topoisomerase IV subunit A